MTERRRESGLKELIEEVRKKEDEMRAELAIKREERREEVQELNWPRAMEELAAYRNWSEPFHKARMVCYCPRCSPLFLIFIPFIHHLQRIKSASLGTHLSLASLGGLSDAILAHVSTMTHLKSIDLRSTSGFSAEGIKHLYRLPHLETLDLQFTDVSDSALEGIGSLSNLVELHLWKTKVTNAGMVHVGRLTGLEKLLLGGTAVTDDGLQQLSALTKITFLFPPEGGYLMYDDARRRKGG
ncbi:unnamed protein product [Closterium sp. NIES-53]